MIPYLDAAVIQSEVGAFVTFVEPIVRWIPGPMGNMALAFLQGLASDTSLTVAVCDAVNKYTGQKPPVAPTS